MRAKKIGWYLLAFAQVFLILNYVPPIAKATWPYIFECLVPDKADGKPLSF